MPVWPGVKDVVPFQPWSNPLVVWFEYPLSFTSTISMSLVPLFSRLNSTAYPVSSLGVKLTIDRLSNVDELFWFDDVCVAKSASSTKPPINPIVKMTTPNVIVTSIVVLFILDALILEELT